jgi:hypothetical protein
MLKVDDSHAAFALSESQKVYYVTVISSLVLADGHMHEKEMQWLNTLSSGLGLSATSQQTVMEAIRMITPEMREARLAWIRKDPALCHALMADAIVMVMSDGQVVQAEAREIGTIGAALNISVAQTNLIGRYVESVVMGDGAAKEEPGPRSRELADGLVQAGLGALPSVRWLNWLYGKLAGRA